MTCYDCIHKPVCFRYGFTKDVEELCPSCKNKTDFVEVVRCKDCKWAEQVMIGQCVNWICKCPWMFGRYVRDGFCNYGERRDT